MSLQNIIKRQLHKFRRYQKNVKFSFVILSEKKSILERLFKLNHKSRILAKTAVFKYNLLTCHSDFTDFTSDLNIKIFIVLS